jgi:jacalin-like lectin domain-containing protein
MDTPITNIGDGFSSFTGSAFPSTIKFNARNTDQRLTSTKVFVCHDTRAMENALNVNASVAVSSTWGAANARMNFINNNSINSTSLVILAVGYTSIRTASVVNPAFQSTFQDAADLYREGGDSYVSSITYGAQFIASYTFEAHDSSTYRNLVAVANATFGGVMTTFNASFDASLTSITKQTQIQFTYERTGLGITVNLPEAGDVVTFIDGFNTVPIDAPYILDFSTTSYIHLANAPSNFATVEKYRKQFINSTPDDMGFADLELLTDTYITAVNRVRAFYDIYGLSTVDPQFSTVLSNLRSMKKALSSWRNAVDTNPTDSGIPDPVLALDYLGLPTPVFTISQSTLFGVPNQGSGFMDITTADVIKGVMLTNLNCRTGDVLNNIQQTWDYFAPDAESNPFTQSHGGNNGDFQVPMTLGQNERVTQVTIGTSDSVTFLSIATNLNLNKWQVSGTNGIAPPVSVSVPSDSYFIGFSGKSENFVREVALIYVQFGPAVWKWHFPPSQLKETSKKG